MVSGYAQDVRSTIYTMLTDTEGAIMRNLFNRLWGRGPYAPTLQSMKVLQTVETDFMPIAQKEKHGYKFRLFRPFERRALLIISLTCAVIGGGGFAYTVTHPTPIVKSKRHGGCYIYYYKGRPPITCNHIPTSTPIKETTKVPPSTPPPHK